MGRNKQKCLQSKEKFAIVIADKKPEWVMPTPSICLKGDPNESYQ